jgi:hypothetical protein
MSVRVDAPNGVVSLTEAAKRLGISRVRLVDAANGGVLPAFQAGRYNELFVQVSALMELMPGRFHARLR